MWDIEGRKCGSRGKMRNKERQYSNQSEDLDCAIHSVSVVQKNERYLLYAAAEQILTGW
jgi:hypothetical protein